jgi:hypothetical protein
MKLKEPLQGFKVIHGHLVLHLALYIIVASLEVNVRSIKEEELKQTV